MHNRFPTRLPATFAVLFLALALSSCGGSASSSFNASRPPTQPPRESPTASPIEHLVVVVMQNRSFNHLFGVFPGADGIRPGVNGYAQQDADGNTVTPFLLTDLSTPDLPHNHAQYLNAWNQGAMDGYAAQNGAISLGYYDGNTPGIAKLWQWASEYALADRYFASVMSNAPANPLYLVAASDNDFPWSVQPYYGPCNKPDSAAKPFTFPNVGDQLSDNKVAWGWFHELYGLCGEGYVTQQNPFQYFTSTHDSPNIQDLSKLYERLDAGTLPAVSFVQPAPYHSMHPGSGSVERAANWLDGLLRRLQGSSAWPRMAVVVLWEESGGWWDHVPPPQVDSQGYGPRVPLIAVSPFAKRGYISHVEMDHVSVLKFIQWNWRLAPLNSRNQMGRDLRDLFQF